MATFNADAQQVINRASELAVEQRARFDEWMKTHSNQHTLDFFIQTSEVQASIKLNDFLMEYARLMGFVLPGQSLHMTKVRT